LNQKPEAGEQGTISTQDEPKTRTPTKPWWGGIGRLFAGFRVPRHGPAASDSAHPGVWRRPLDEAGHSETGRPSYSIFWVATSAIFYTLVVISVMIYLNLFTPPVTLSSEYQDSLRFARMYYNDSKGSPGFRPEIALNYMAQIARAQESLFFRTALFWLGFVVLFLGGLLVSSACLCSTLGPRPSLEHGRSN
jgi:hypothetical protein